MLKTRGKFIGNFNWKCNDRNYFYHYTNHGNGLSFLATSKLAAHFFFAFFFNSKYRDSSGIHSWGSKNITNKQLSRASEQYKTDREITIRGGMLADCCVRIPRKSTNSAWLGSFPAADGSNDVALNMDLIEGRVRYRKGKKVRRTSKLIWCAIQR